MPSTEARPQRTTIYGANQPLSSRAVDLLLTLEGRDWQDDASVDRLDWVISSADEPESDDATQSAYDLALATLETGF